MVYQLLFDMYASVYICALIGLQLLFNNYSYSMNISPFCFFFLSGFQVVVAVQFCSCEPDFLRLLRFNFWGATPTKPELAFTMDLMKLLLTLNLECQVAVKEFCSAIQTLVNDIISFPALRKF